MALHVVDHPLVRHKLGLLRKESTSTSEFRMLAKEIARMLTYEASANMPTEKTAIEGWAGTVEVDTMAGKMVTIVPILRAGIGLMDGVLDMIPGANVSKALRTKLGEQFDIFNVDIARKLESQLDDTVKYLYKLNHDGEFIESVLMRYHYGDTVCVSTQVGCRMGCRFCASGQNGLTRSLTPSEMLSQITAAQNDTGRRVSHIVMMGMGEPFDNYDNAIRFIRLATSPKGLNLSARHVTLSTCGVVKGIRRFAEEGLPVTLSVSLHAPNDAVRDSIMPVNKSWGVDEVLEAAGDYAKVTGRRVSYEYALFKGINDTDANAKELASKLKGTLSHVNLIPGNHVDENDLVSSDPSRVKRFAYILENSGIPTTVRRTLGSDINASCGQLRKEGKANVDCKSDR